MISKQEVPAAVPAITEGDLVLYSDNNEADAPDLLGTKEYAKQIAESIATRHNRQDKCFVFAIWGAWGSGKSRLISYLKEELNRKKRIKVIEFKPWSFSGRENITRKFFDAILDEYYPSHRGQKWLCFALFLAAVSGFLWPREITEYFKHEPWFSIVCFSVGVATALRLLMLYIKPAEKSLELASIWLRRRFGGPKSLSALSNWAETVSEASDSKIISKIAKVLLQDDPDRCREEAEAEFEFNRDHTVIIVDDLDRLMPIEVTELLRVIRAAGDFPNVTYVISADKDHVAKALASSKVVADVKEGREYLEKLVQYSAEIPAPKKGALLRELKLRLDKVFPGENWHNNLAGYLSSDESDASSRAALNDPNNPYVNLGYLWLRSMRDVDRLSTTVAVTYPLIRTAIADDEELRLAFRPLEFLTLQAMQLFDNDMYQELRSARRVREFSSIKNTLCKDASQERKNDVEYIFDNFNILGHARDASNDEERQDEPFWDDTSGIFEVYFRYAKPIKYLYDCSVDGKRNSNEICHDFGNATTDADVRVWAWSRVRSNETPDGRHVVFGPYSRDLTAPHAYLVTFSIRGEGFQSAGGELDQVLVLILDILWRNGNSETIMGQLVVSAGDLSRPGYNDYTISITRGCPGEWEFRALALDGTTGQQDNIKLIQEHRQKNGESEDSVQILFRTISFSAN